jgi:hypothetical protein
MKPTKRRRAREWWVVVHDNCGLMSCGFRDWDGKKWIHKDLMGLKKDNPLMYKKARIIKVKEILKPKGKRA